jgi:hypothetical protein
MTTLNRRLSETLDSGNAATEVFKYRKGALACKLLVSGSGTFGGGTVTLRRSSPGGSEVTTIDTWTAAFVEFVEPVANGDYSLAVSGGGGTEDIAVVIEMGAQE